MKMIVQAQVRQQLENVFSGASSLDIADPAVKRHER
jgi:hypothetical protein